MLFRQIRLITGDASKYNKYIVFVNCKGATRYKDEMVRIVQDGFIIHGRKFVNCERSASMVRTSILSFVDAEISEELTRRVVMDIQLDKTVLSKWYAYRGLMLSSCHCIEDWYPRIIIVPDYEKVIPNQNIKYVYDKEVELKNKDTGEPFIWKSKDIATGIRDIKINVFDGCGIHHPDITDTVRGILNAKTDPTTILWRAPFIKGVTHEMDYVTFFAEHGITSIKDKWGVEHDVSPTAEPAIIMCESMYKGFKYFKNYGDVRDWQHYWDMFRKYNHCIGVTKWNFSLEEEPVYTRVNYQVLQDLDLSFDDFELLAKTSVEWINNIMSGDKTALNIFLGLTADTKTKPNCYMEALLKNREMIKEVGVRQHVSSLLDKAINEMKCGKLYLKSCFKFLAPDLLMLMQHIGGLEPTGCLAADEFFTFNNAGQMNGEFLIERNPHICKSEHVVLRAVNNEMTDKYFSHLPNVCIVNGHSITPQRLNGADYDGDLVLVVDDETMMKGVHRDVPIVIDIEDKATVIEEADTPENQARAILRGSNSLIGETSNCATGYHNKTPHSEEMKQVYESYIDLLSVINGKAIDSAKTGIIYNIPKHIAKHSKPLPYFMKYASPYYGKMKKFSYAHSNMNLLCRRTNKWHRTLKWKRYQKKDFDYTIMMDKGIPINESVLRQIEKIYKEFVREFKQLNIEYTNALEAAANRKPDDENYEYVSPPNWNGFYNKYRNRCFDICPNVCELANYVVLISYREHPCRPKKFMWVVGSEGILANLKQVEKELPCKDPNGSYEYLGKKYRMELINNN